MVVYLVLFKRNVPLVKSNNWADDGVCITIIILPIGIKRNTKYS